MALPWLPHHLQWPPRLHHPVSARPGPSDARKGGHQDPRDIQRGIRDWLALDHPRDRKDRSLRQRLRRYGYGRDQSLVYRRLCQRRRRSRFLAPHGTRISNPFLFGFKFLIQFLFKFGLVLLKMHI